ncbi:MAG TPA: hypothetical protein VHY59_10835 [Chthoniobacterales bacterium]|nr:hypothetical protein [Chthoniobacterales bacterium]
MQRAMLSGFWYDFTHGGWFLGGIIASFLASIAEVYPFIIGTIVGVIIVGLFCYYKKDAEFSGYHWNESTAEFLERIKRNNDHG